MITLTDNAAKQIKTLIVSQGAAGKSLRVYVEGGGCCSGPKYGLAFDNKQADDEVFEQDGVQVVVDPESAGVLSGSVIDYVVSSQGEGFQIKAPRAHNHEHSHEGGGCGCHSGGCGCEH